MNKNKTLIIVSSLIVLIGIFVTIFIINTNKKNNTFYEITFDTQDGSVIENQSIKKGEKIKVPESPTKEGYEFVEWYYENQSYDFNTVVTANMTLVAQWKATENEIFTVKFNSDGGTVVSEQNIENGKKIEMPENPTKEGYNFIEWQLNGVKYDFDLPVTANLELVAVYEKIETETPTINTKPSTTNPSNNKPNNNGNNSGNKTTPSQPSTPSQPTTPTTPTEKKTYTVTFDSNGGSSVNSQTVNEGNRVSQPSNPTKSGYNFGGWLLNGSNYNFNTPVTGNITLVAKWNQKSYTVKVTNVDQYSPDRILTVYEDGKKISVSAIKYNGTTLCSGSNMVVNMYEIEGISSVTVVLTNGTSVTASVQ